VAVGSAKAGSTKTALGIHLGQRADIVLRGKNKKSARRFPTEAVPYGRAIAKLFSFAIRNFFRKVTLKFFHVVKFRLGA